MCINKNDVCMYVNPSKTSSLCAATVSVLGRRCRRRRLLVLHLLVLHRLLKQDRGDEPDEEHHVHPPVVPLPALVRLLYV